MVEGLLGSRPAGVGRALTSLPRDGPRELRVSLVRPQAIVLVAHSGAFTFPADHAGAVPVGLVSRRLGYLAAATALRTVFARVRIGRDWPGEVAAGLVCGAVVVAVGFLLDRRALVRLFVALSPTRPPPLLTAGSPAPPTIPAHARAWAQEVLAGGGVR